MSLVSEPNINQLIQSWKKNTPMVSKTLEQMGYSLQLLNRYKQSGWIQSLGHGAYALKGQEVLWTGGIYALQTQLRMPVHPGGLTALEWHGLAHFLNMGNRSVFLYGAAVKNLPLWFRKLTENQDMEVVKGSALPSHSSFLVFREIGDFSIQYSTPELAFLEMLHEVPRRVTFDEARQIAENLTLLRSDLLQTLLEQTGSIKVCRMALYLGEYHQQDWFHKLKVDKIDLGSGKRVIHPGGVLNKKYNITVPLEEEEPFV